FPLDHISAEPVDNCKKISEPGNQGDISNIPSPCLIGMINNKIPQQIGKLFMFPVCCAQIRLRINGLQSHYLHCSSYPFWAYQKSLFPHLYCHPPSPVIG